MKNPNYHIHPYPLNRWKHLFNFFDHKNNFMEFSFTEAYRRTRSPKEKKPQNPNNLKFSEISDCIWTAVCFFPSLPLHSQKPIRTHTWKQKKMRLITIIPGSSKVQDIRCRKHNEILTINMQNEKSPAEESFVGVSWAFTGLKKMYRVHIQTWQHFWH